MATQFAEQNTGTEIPGEAAPVDYETEARKIGWRSLAELDGKVDPTRFVDAETFFKRGQEVMPILKATNKRLERELADMKKTLAKASEHFEKAEARAYERAIAEIKVRQEAAVESGDVAAFRAADADADKLRKEIDAGKSAPTADDEAQRAEDFADWGKANKWYASNPVMQAYADSQAQIMARSKGGILDRADLDAVAEKVKGKFEDEFPDDFAAPAPRQKRPHVDAGGQRQPVRGGKTFADLPAEAREAADKWIKQGLIKSRDEYVKSYPW